MPRRLFPWAAMSTLLPALIWGAISSFQKGRARAMVSLRLSQVGSSPGFRPAYRRSWGCPHLLFPPKKASPPARRSCHPQGPAPSPSPGAPSSPTLLMEL